MSNIIRIDGEYGEGGGSIVRFSMAFACLLKKPIEIYNIRANRKNPGLRTQHLTGIRLIQQIFGGVLVGDKIGSTKISYSPDLDYNFKTKFFQVQIDTAASLGLIFQTLQLVTCALKEEIKIELLGGATYGLWAPSIDYISKVTLQYLRFFDVNFDITVEKHGFYPKGDAKVILTLKPSMTTNNEGLSFIERSEKPLIKGISLASTHLQRSHVAERTAKASMNFFEKKGFNSEIEVQYVQSNSIGSGITIWTNYVHPFGSSFVGQKHISAENVGESVATIFIKDWNNNGILDEFMTDQIIPFMALKSTEILTGPLTNHSKTNIWICKQFLETEFEIKNIKDSLYSIKTQVD